MDEHDLKKEVDWLRNHPWIFLFSKPILPYHLA